MLFKELSVSTCLALSLNPEFPRADPIHPFSLTAPRWVGWVVLPPGSRLPLHFDVRDGPPCGLFRKWVLYPAMDRAGIKRGSRTHGFYLFRHTAGSIVHEKTGSVKLAQTHLGHARLDTTANTYVHVDDGQSREAAEAVADAILPFCPLVAHSEPIEAGQIQ